MATRRLGQKAIGRLGEMGILLFLLCPSAPLFALSVSFSARPPAEKAILGTPLRLELEASYPEGFSLQLDTTSAQSDSFALLNISSEKKQAAGGRITEKMTLATLPLDMGISTFPSLAWTAVPESTVISTFSIKAFSPPIPMEISAAAVSGEDREIKDIRPPVRPFPWPLLLALLLLAGAAGFALSVWRRSQKTATITAHCPDDIRLPDIAALEDLSALIASGIWEEGRFREFYERLAEITRLYVEKSMGIPAPLMTTSDLIRQLRKTGRKLSGIGEAHSLLDACDMVKFAKLVPSTTEKERDCALLQKFVETTRPAPPEPEKKD
jgi:hypothetical protein